MSKEFTSQINVSYDSNSIILLCTKLKVKFVKVVWLMEIVFKVKIRKKGQMVKIGKDLSNYLLTRGKTGKSQFISERTKRILPRKIKVENILLQQLNDLKVNSSTFLLLP